MKLAFCLFKYYPYGGLERDFLRIVNTAIHRGHEVKVFTHQWQGKIPDSLNHKIIYIPLSKFALSNHKRVKQFAEKLKQLLIKEKFDKVIGFNRFPEIDFYYAGDPCYLVQASNKHHSWYKLLPRFRTYSELEKGVFSTSSSAKILLLNPAHKNDFIDHYHTDEKRFITLMPGIGDDRKKPDNQLEIRAAVRKNYGITQTQNIILMVGSDFKRKGVERALQALSTLSPTTKENTFLWVIGKGHAAPLKKLSKKLGIEQQIIFWGPQDDLIRFYAAADLLLHTAHQETAGMVLIESIVAGLPVIVTANCGYAFYIQQAKAGEIIPEPFKQSHLNNALSTLLSQPELIQTYKKNALQFAHLHDFFNLGEECLKAIEHDNIEQK